MGNCIHQIWRCADQNWQPERNRQQLRSRIRGLPPHCRGAPCTIEDGDAGSGAGLPVGWKTKTLTLKLNPESQRRKLSSVEQKFTRFSFVDPGDLCGKPLILGRRVSLRSPNDLIWRKRFTLRPRFTTSTRARTSVTPTPRWLATRLRAASA